MTTNTFYVIIFNMIKITKKEQLGIDPGTAQYRLVKDILFDLIKDRPCYRCGEIMTRETFSIEHKVPWLHSENPIELFFDLENIDFSHLKCNSKSKRINRKYKDKDEQRKHFTNVARKKYQNYSQEEKDKINEKRRLKRNLIPTEERQKIRREKYKKYKC